MGESRDLAPSVREAVAAGLRPGLESLRTRLAAELDGTAGHLPSCECQCAVTVAGSGTVPQLVKALMEVIRAIDDLPEESGGSILGKLGDEVARKRREREAG